MDLASQFAGKQVDLQMMKFLSVAAQRKILAHTWQCQVLDHTFNSTLRDSHVFTLRQGVHEKPCPKMSFASATCEDQHLEAWQSPHTLWHKDFKA